MQELAPRNATAGMLTQNFKETVKQFSTSDEAFSFMNFIKGNPAYWKRFLSEVLAMVKQFGLSMYFLTFSFAYLRWNKFISIISKVNKLNLSEEEGQSLSYQERCKLFNMNPVLVARHFQYQVEVFFNEILVDGPLGKTKYYVIRSEFQVRGTPHIHSFLWILNAPVLSKDTIDHYKEWVDSNISARIPDSSKNPKRFELVKIYQLHRH